MEIDGVHGKVDGIVGIGGVREAVHDVGGTVGILSIFENFAVNSIETISIVNFAENYFESTVH